METSGDSPFAYAHFGAITSNNRQICGFIFGYAQISQGETSHIRKTLGNIALEGGMINGRRTLPTVYEMSNKSN